jgi:hypothetical protein
LKKLTLAIFLYVLLTGSLSAAGKGEPSIVAYSSFDNDMAAADVRIVESAAPVTNDPAVSKRAEEVMKALSLSFPRLVGRAVFRDGDWAVPLRGEWFYFAEGRLLPDRLRDRAADFTPQPFYPYPEKLPAWEKPSWEEGARMVEAAKNRQTGRLPRSLIFYDTLWNVRTRAEAWDQVKTLKFLKKEILVHHAILEPLALVEQKINRASLRERETANWLKQIASITAWNWRNIADVKSRSNHAYGIAIDILPKSNRLETYWLWSAQKNIEWWNVPYSRRYQPPDTVIKIFEEYGFVWGGKWSFYDTMHFEYRPEILIYNNIPVNGEY